MVVALLCAAVPVSAADPRQGHHAVSSLLEQATVAARTMTEDAYLRNTALRGIAGAQAESGGFEAALKTAALIGDAYLQTGAWRQIAVAQARAGHRAEAGTLIKKVLETAATLKHVPLLQVDALIATADAQARIGDVPGALTTAASVGNPRGKDEALRNIALAQANNGDVTGALNSAGTIADETMKAQALRGITEFYAKQGDRDGALRIVAAIRDPYVKAGALRAIAIAPAMLKDRAIALDILKQALESAGTIQGENEKADALGGITMALLAAGDVSGALKAAALIEQAGVGTPRPNIAVGTRSEVLRAIAIAHAQAGDSPRAFQTVGSIAIPYMRASALAGIAAAQVERGDQVAAGETLRKAMQVASAILELTAKVPALMGIAQVYATVGDRAAAVRTFGKARQAIRVIEDDRYHTDALMDLAMVQSGAGDFSGAVDSADGIRDLYARAHAWRVIAAAQGEHREQVFSWIAKDGEAVKKAYALLGLAEGLLQRTR